MSTADSSYWCYRCSSFVRLLNDDDATASASVVCPDCGSGFVEVVDDPTRLPHLDSRRSRISPAAAMFMIGANNRRSDFNPDRVAPAQSGLRRLRRNNNGDRSPFNPVIVLRGGAAAAEEGRGFELFYDDGDGSGLRPLPTSMSEILLGSGSGFERLLEQLSQIEINGIGRCEQRPAAKSAIESMPTVELGAADATAEHHCAVCKEAFEIGTEAREMPCKHLYHSDCILPWLSIRNSCPVCRHELPTETEPTAESGRVPGQEDEESSAGMTIWRLPGGGLAVGRFSGGRRGVERELPEVYTEMDGGFNGGGAPRRVSLGRSVGRPRQGGGFGRFFRNLFGCFSRVGSGSATRLVTSPRHRRVRLVEMEPTVTTTSMPGRRRTWSMDVNSGIVRW